MTNRRGFLLGAGAALIASPAIVRAASLMPVKVWKHQGDTTEKSFALRPRTDGLYMVESVAALDGGLFYYSLVMVADPRVRRDWTAGFLMAPGEQATILTLLPKADPNIPAYDWKTYD